MTTIKSLSSLAAYEVFSFLIEGKKVEVASAAWANGSGFRQALFRYRREYIKKTKIQGSIEVIRKSEDGTKIVLEWQVKKEVTANLLTEGVPYAIVE